MKAAVVKGACVLLALIVVLVVLLVLWWTCHVHPHIRAMLIWGAHVFNEEGIEYWVDYGSLLGLVRGGDVIIWDNDVDFCVLDCPDLDAKLWRAAGKLFDSGIVWTRVSDGIYRFYHRSLPMIVHADVFRYTRDGETLRGPEGPKSDISAALVGSPQTREFQGVVLKVPEKVHETLVWRYGDDYMTPKPLFKGRGA